MSPRLDKKCGNMNTNPLTPLSSDHCTNFHKSQLLNKFLWTTLVFKHTVFNVITNAQKPLKYSQYTLFLQKLCSSTTHFLLFCKWDNQTVKPTPCIDASNFPL